MKKVKYQLVRQDDVPDEFIRRYVAHQFAISIVEERIEQSDIKVRPYHTDEFTGQLYSIEFYILSQSEIRMLMALVPDGYKKALELLLNS